MRLGFRGGGPFISVDCDDENRDTLENDKKGHQDRTRLETRPGQPHKVRQDKTTQGSTHKAEQVSNPKSSNEYEHDHNNTTTQSKTRLDKVRIRVRVRGRDRIRDRTRSRVRFNKTK